MTEERLPDGTRRGLAQAMERAWQRLARPGTWWTGAERLAIVAETRQADACVLCQTRKEALSPNHVEGRHDSLGILDEAVVEAIHRIRTDAGRVSSGWLKGLLEQGLEDTHYIELVGVVSTLSALDAVDLTMGHQQRALPEPVAGKPKRHRPSGAQMGLGWLPTLNPDGLTPQEPDFFSKYGDYNVQKAMSLVPDEVMGFFDLDTELYFYERELPQRAEQEAGRAITPMQIEMIAARAASLNGCHY
ncbi:MAG: alkylhydroperoxidase-related (seleno)protein [Alphaproteobacteria bacterium]|jgi:hypothetical protein